MRPTAEHKGSIPLIKFADRYVVTSHCHRIPNLNRNDYGPALELGTAVLTLAEPNLIGLESSRLTHDPIAVVTAYRAIHIPRLVCLWLAFRLESTSNQRPGGEVIHNGDRKLLRTNWDDTAIQGERFVRYWMRAYTTEPGETEYLNLTGYEFRGQIRTAGSSDQIAAEYEFELTDNPITGEPNGAVRITLSEISTAALAASVYRHDVFATPLGGGPTVPLRGTLRIEPRITR